MIARPLKPIKIKPTGYREWIPVAIRTQIWGFRNFVGSEDMISRMSEFLNRKK